MMRGNHNEFARTNFSIARADALAVFCEYCKAQPGKECSDPKTGYVLLKQPAHTRRLKDAGTL